VPLNVPGRRGCWLLFVLILVLWCSILCRSLLAGALRGEHALRRPPLLQHIAVAIAAAAILAALCYAAFTISLLLVACVHVVPGPLACAALRDAPPLRRPRLPTQATLSYLL
jgi:hypothetical protein